MMPFFIKNRSFIYFFSIFCVVELQRKFVRFLFNKIKPLDKLILESKNYDLKTKLSRGLMYSKDNLGTNFLGMFSLGITSESSMKLRKG